MKKKKLTNKERDAALGGLSNNDKIIWKEILELKQEVLEFKQHFTLYLDYRQKVFKEEVKDYHEFVKGIVEEFEKQQRSGDKKGA